MAQAGYTPISLYYSTTASAAPTAGNLVPGELAINITDGKLYYEDNLGAVQLLAAGSGALGDVVGPASSTANAIPTFNGTTGKLIQNNSGVTIAAGVITATGFSGPINGTVGATTPNTGVFTQVDITAQGDLRLQDASGGEYVAFQAPSTLASSYTLTMPSDDGASGQVLTTDGSGGLSWSTNAGGDVFGPASATDNAIARFDGTTGKLIQNSAVTVADTTGDITGGTYNKVTITAPATGSTLTITDGKTLTINASLAFSGTDSTTMTFPATTTTVAGLGIAQTFTQDQTIAGNLTMNAQGDVRFADSDSSNWVAFQGAATITSNVTWTLPAADGSNGQFLSTNGSGALSWTSGGAGDVVGPASSTDNAFARFDLTTGKLIQNSSATLDDNGAPTFVGSVAISGTSVSGADIKLYEDTDNGTNYVAFKAPASISSDVTWTLPSADGTSGQFLSTNGSGTLSWATGGGGGGITTGKSIAMAMIFGF